MMIRNFFKVAVVAFATTAAAGSEQLPIAPETLPAPSDHSTDKADKDRAGSKSRPIRRSLRTRRRSPIVRRTLSRRPQPKSEKRIAPCSRFVRCVIAVGTFRAKTVGACTILFAPTAVLVLMPPVYVHTATVV